MPLLTISLQNTEEFQAIQWLFPEVGRFLPENLNEPRNAMTMVAGLHAEFGALRLCLELTVR